MPVKDGNAAIREIIDFDKDAEIIIVSSVGTQSQLRSAIEAGAKDFIQKPLNPEQLHSILTSRLKGDKICTHSFLEHFYYLTM